MGKSAKSVLRSAVRAERSRVRRCSKSRPGLFRRIFGSGKVAGWLLAAVPPVVLSVVFVASGFVPASAGAGVLELAGTFVMNVLLGTIFGGLITTISVLVVALLGATIIEALPKSSAKKPLPGWAVWSARLQVLVDRYGDVLQPDLVSDARGLLSQVRSAGEFLMWYETAPTSVRAEFDADYVRSEKLFSQIYEFHGLLAGIVDDFTTAQLEAASRMEKISAEYTARRVRPDVSVELIDLKSTSELVDTYRKVLNGS